VTRRIATLGCALALLAAAALGSGRAWAEHPDARQTALEGNPWRLDPAGRGALSLESSETLRHLELQSWLSLQHVDAPLVLRREGETLRELVAQRQVLGLGLVLGLLHRFELGLDLPVTLRQDATLPGYRLGDAQGQGLGKLQVFGRSRLVEQGAAPLGLGLTVAAALPTETEGGYFGAAGWGGEARLALSRRQGPLLLLANLGYRLQAAASLLDYDQDDLVLAGLGLRYQPPGVPLSLEAAAQAATLAKAPLADAREVYGELDAGVRYALGAGFDLLGGLGSALSPGAPSPALRVFLGLGFGLSLRPDRDRDGVLDPVDRCPDEAEDEDQFEDGDGCPERDNDQDGLEDPQDRCPNEAEDKDGFEDEDGCPDPDNDRDGIPDGQDDCPEAAEDGGGRAPADGCPDADGDDDGVPDARDRCPNEAEDKDGFADDDGCPDGDNDGDGIPDAEDACPNEVEDGSGQAPTDGCPNVDRDGDGRPDAQDGCPDAAEDLDGYQDEDGCPEPDNDGDGIPDTEDRCRGAAEDVDGFEDADGCPDPDNDGDGILDAADRCPDEPEDGRGAKPTDGCPDRLAVRTRSEIVITQEIHFATGRAGITAPSRRILAEVLEVLLQAPELRVRIEGHTDGRGDERMNLDLSRARARAVRKWLVRQAGADHDLARRLEARGYGESVPVAPNETREGRAQNRRVVFRLLPSTPGTDPGAAPDPTPSPAPSAAPSPAPSAAPSPAPSAAPSPAPSAAPSPAPSAAPVPAPSAAPSAAPSPAAVPQAPQTPPEPSPGAPSGAPAAAAPAAVAPAAVAPAPPDEPAAPQPSPVAPDPSAARPRARP